MRQTHHTHTHKERERETETEGDTENTHTHRERKFRCTYDGECRLVASLSLPGSRLSLSRSLSVCLSWVHTFSFCVPVSWRVLRSGSEGRVGRAGVTTAGPPAMMTARSTAGYLEAGERKRTESERCGASTHIYIHTHTLSLSHSLSPALLDHHG